MRKNVLSLCDLLLEDNLNPTRLKDVWRQTNKSYVYLYQTFWQICFTIEMQIFCFFLDLSGYLCIMMVHVYYTPKISDDCWFDNRRNFSVILPFAIASNWMKLRFKHWNDGACVTVFQQKLSAILVVIFFFISLTANIKSANRIIEWMFDCLLRNTLSTSLFIACFVFFFFSKWHPIFAYTSNLDRRFSD